MATITGLNSNRYYVNNPIWVDVDKTGDADQDEPITMSISINSEIVFLSKYYPFNGVVSFDVSEVMKGFVTEPNHPINPSIGQILQLSTVQATITLSSFSFTRVFFRGGEDSNRTNISVPNNAVLSESLKIPTWNGYPSAKYYLNNNGEIIYTTILTPSETEQRKINTCNPVFLRFLNTKGGYSFWLFDEWELSKITKATDIIKRRGNDLDLGLEASHELSLSSRVEQRYTPTLRALLQSQEVSIYNIQNIIKEDNPTFQQSFEWSRIYNDGGSMKWNSFDSVNEFSFKFNLNFKNNPTLVW